MEIKWLNKLNNSKLIVFFNGWGFNENIVNNLDFGSFDVLICYDYRILETFDIDLSMYKEKYLIAWSLGVFICNFYFDKFKDFNRFTAINGTQKPIDDNFGIPCEAYNLTINNFNEFTCKKFIKKINAPIEIEKSIDDLKNELISIKNTDCTKFLSFNKAIISRQDRIFPYKNTHSFWEKEGVFIEEIDAPHYIFDKYKNWSEII